MRRALPHALASEWGPDFTRGVGVSAILHIAVAALLVWIASRAPAPPPPLTSYTVELTDPAALGGRLAFGPLDRPLGRPRRIAEAAGGAVAGAPSPGESAAAEAAQAAKAAESRKPVAPARVAEAPKPPESAKAKDPDAPVVLPKPVPAPAETSGAAAPPKPVAPPVTVRPSSVDPAPAAAPPRPREPEVRLADKSKPREQPKPVAPPVEPAPSQAAKGEATPAPKQAPPATLPAEPPAQAAPPTTLATPTTVPTPTTLPEPTASPEPPDAREAPAARPDSPGAVTAHPVPAAPTPALPRADATAKKPAGAAEGARVVPAKPVAPAPAPGVGTAAKPAPDLQASGGGGVGSGGSAETPARDDYAAAAERWRSRMSGGMGGMAGAQSEQGTVGDGTTATGGGGSVVGFEFLSYRQRIFGLIKGNWANAARRDGLIAAVRFELAPDGTVSGIQLVRSSGDRTYDQSVVRAVQRSNPLPPPPERYRNEFREVVIDFYSEEQGGQGAG